MNQNSHIHKSALVNKRTLTENKQESPKKMAFLLGENRIYILDKASSMNG
jgi:hypothetical protein